MSKLSKESAEKELDRLYKYYELDKEDLEKKTAEAVTSIEKTLVKGIMNGFISFTENEESGFCVVQKLRSETIITYKEMNGAAKLAMSGKEEDDSTGKCYALLGSLSGLGATAFSSLKGPDLKRAEYIGTLLLLC